MNYYELAIFGRDREHYLLKEAENMNRHRMSCAKSDVVKTILLGLSEILISLGTRIHNIYLPPVEETILGYLNPEKHETISGN